MQCEMCGKEIKKDEAMECASCGAILCSGCDVGGFCAICIGGGMLD